MTASPPRFAQLVEYGDEEESEEVLIEVRSLGRVVLATMGESRSLTPAIAAQIGAALIAAARVAAGN